MSVSVTGDFDLGGACWDVAPGDGLGSTDVDVGFEAVGATGDGVLTTGVATLAGERAELFVLAADIDGEGFTARTGLDDAGFVPFCVGFATEAAAGSVGFVTEEDAGGIGFVIGTAACDVGFSTTEDTGGVGFNTTEDTGGVGFVTAEDAGGVGAGFDLGAVVGGDGVTATRVRVAALTGRRDGAFAGGREFDEDAAAAAATLARYRSAIDPPPVFVFTRVSGLRALEPGRCACDCDCDDDCALYGFEGWFAPAPPPRRAPDGFGNADVEAAFTAAARGDEAGELLLLAAFCAAEERAANGERR